MGAKRKLLESEKEVDGAVDELMLSMGLAPGAAPPDEGADFEESNPRARMHVPKNAREEAAPSPAPDALWGSPSPRRK